MRIIIIMIIIIMITIMIIVMIIILIMIIITQINSLLSASVTMFSLPLYLFLSLSLPLYLFLPSFLLSKSSLTPCRHIKITHKLTSNVEPLSGSDST
jgi:hypothetical protein